MSEGMNEIDKAKAVLAQLDPEQWPNLVIALDDFVNKSASPHPEAREEDIAESEAISHELGAGRFVHGISRPINTNQIDEPIVWQLDFAATLPWGEEIEGIEGEGSWFLIDQRGKVWEYGPTKAPAPLGNEYTRAIPLLKVGDNYMTWAEIISRLATPKPEGEDRTVETVVFDNNAIPYGQDMQFYTGVPAHIRFAVTRINEERYKLTAPGYGGETYGNGAIYVKASDLPAAPEPRPAEEPVDADWQDNECHPEPAPVPSEEAYAEAIYQADNLADEVKHLRSRLAEAIRQRDLEYKRFSEAERNEERAATELATLRSQLTRKDEGMRETMNRLADKWDSECGRESFAPVFAEELRAALREPDGRNGE